jgi:hypothetical protein
VLNIPDDPRNWGHKFFFSVGIDVLEQKIPTRVYYRLLLSTGEKAPEPVKP